MAFSKLEPFGSDASYIGHAITSATVANYSPNRRRGSKALKPEDFMPKFVQGKKEQTVDEQIQFAAALTLAMGGTVNIPEE